MIYGKQIHLHFSLRSMWNCLTCRTELVSFFWQWRCCANGFKTLFKCLTTGEPKLERHHRHRSEKLPCTVKRRVIYLARMGLIKGLKVTVKSPTLQVLPRATAAPMATKKKGQNNSDTAIQCHYLKITLSKTAFFYSKLPNSIFMSGKNKMTKHNENRNAGSTVTTVVPCSFTTF